MSDQRVGGIPGGSVFGPFALVERLAIGGAADVFLARRADDAVGAPMFVVKRLLPALRNDPVARQSFADEGRLQARVLHENVVRCLEVGAVEEEPYLALEHVAGADLHRVLAISHARKRPFAPPLACFVGRKLLAALSAVHAEGIVHRDVSPSNVYLGQRGEVKLGDFGIARAGAARGAAIRGKYAYLAPEQVASEPVDHRADLFAVANVLAECMLGHPLFPGSGQLAVLLAIRDGRIDALRKPGAVPSALLPVLERALSRSPDARFPSAADFASALTPWAWQDDATACREIAKLVQWTGSASLELRAVGEHPDQKRDPLSLMPPSSVPGSRRATPVHGTPAVPRPPRPALQLDSDLLGDRSPEGPRPAGGIVSTTPFAEVPSRVRTTDGRVLGPFAYAKLVELVATGKLGGADTVDFMGTGFVAITDVDELARHLAPRSTVTRQLEGPGTPDWHGPCAEPGDDGGIFDPGIAHALAFVASRRATGVLIAQDPTRRKEIYFVGGRLFHAATSERTELTGEYLVSRGLLDRADLDFALAVLQRFDGRLGEALTKLGLVDPMQMFRLLQELGRDRVLDIFRWREGELSFYDGAQPGKVEFSLDLMVGPLVEAGVAELVDEAAAGARRKAWTGRRLVPANVPSGLGEAGWSALVLQAHARARSGIGFSALVDGLAEAGQGSVAAVRAVESARLSHLIEWG